MEVNSYGSIVIGVFCQGIVHSKEIEQHLEKRELLQGVLLADYLGEKLYAEVENYLMVATNGDFVIPGFKKNEHN